ncbi:hypothetical protein ACFSTC_55365 [Nonomuraea ferruginea]
MPPFEGTVRGLIEAALRDTDPDGPVRWQVISRLRERGDLECFIEARRLCAADGTAERLLGVDILGLLGGRTWTARCRSCAIWRPARTTRWCCTRC